MPVGRGDLFYDLDNLVDVFAVSGATRADKLCRLRDEYIRAELCDRFDLVNAVGADYRRESDLVRALNRVSQFFKR